MRFVQIAVRLNNEHVNSQENPCPASSECVNCQEDHPAYTRACPKWKIEKKVQEIKVTQAVTFLEAIRIAEGLLGQPHCKTEPLSWLK